VVRREAPTSRDALHVQLRFEWLRRHYLPSRGCHVGMRYNGTLCSRPTHEHVRLALLAFGGPAQASPDRSRRADDAGRWACFYVSARLVCSKADSIDPIPWPAVASQFLSLRVLQLLSLTAYLVSMSSRYPMTAIPLAGRSGRKSLAPPMPL
jgi:hypothetical protein